MNPANETTALILIHPWIGACAITVCILLWAQYRVRLAGSNALTWAGLIVAGGVHSVLSPYPAYVRMLSPVGTIAFSWAMLMYMKELYGISMGWRVHFLSAALSIPGAFLVYYLTGSANWGALVPALAVITGPVEILARIVGSLRRDGRYSPIQLGLAVVLFLHLLVGLGFPYAFTRPELNEGGYTFSAFFLVMECMFMQSSMVEFVAKEQAQLGERLKLQAMMQHSAKTSALGQMAGGVAHEINNPLAILSMRLQRLQGIASQAQEVKSTLLEQDLSKMRSTIDRVAHIVSALRILSADGKQAVTEDVSLNEAVQAVLAVSEKAFSEQGIKVEYTPCAEGDRLRCRRTDLTQIIFSLVQNARDASIAAKASVVRLIAMVQDGQIELSIEDDGIGVDASVSEKIFEPFFSTKPIGQGTGIGLAVSRALAGANGGALELRSRAHPTRFVLTFPQASRLAKDASRVA